MSKKPLSPPFIYCENTAQIFKVLCGRFLQKFAVLKYKENPHHDINLIKRQYKAKRLFRHVILFSIIKSAVL